MPVGMKKHRIASWMQEVVSSERLGAGMDVEVIAINVNERRMNHARNPKLLTGQFR